MKLEGMNCPNCGSPLNFTEDQDFCFCSHCGTQVYKDDVHFDRKMDFEEHKIDKNTEIELAKIRAIEKSEKFGAIAAMVFFGVMAIIIVAIMIAIH